MSGLNLPMPPFMLLDPAGVITVAGGVTYQGRSVDSTSSYLPTIATTPWCPYSFLPLWVGNLELGSRSTAFFSTFGRELAEMVAVQVIPRSAQAHSASLTHSPLLPNMHGESQ